MHMAALWNANALVKDQLAAGALVGLAMCILLQVFIKRRRKALSSSDEGEFPRGPPAWPIVGHLPLLKTAAHKVLAELCLKQGYGPMMGLRLGSQPVVVVSSVALAKELLLTHDKTFANRPAYQFVDTLFYGYDTAVIFSSYNPHWSRFRKIYTLELFTPKRLQQLQHIRQAEVRGALRALLQASRGGTQAVDVGRLLTDMTANTTSRLLQSKTLTDVSPELPELIRSLEHQAVPMLSDFVPWLKFVDVLQKRSMKQLHNRIDKIIDSIIHERRQLMAKFLPDELPHDFLQVILSREGVHEDDAMLTSQEIKGIILDIFAGGIQTSAVALEWAIAELLQNSSCLQRLREEIDAVMGERKDMVKDEDIVDKMPYLENIVKEVLRLHAIAPLLVPRISSKACKMDKYTLPKNTQALVNAWAIMRDPLVWERPEVFWPERFEGKDIDMRGQHYELLPFGSGRRVCPGLRLGLSVVHVTLANLVRTFDWELPYGQSPSCIDMREKGGIGVSKALPMLAIPKLRIPSKLEL